MGGALYKGPPGADDNPKPKVFVTRRLPQEALDLIMQETEMDLWPDEYPPAPEALRQRVQDVDGILTNIMDRVDAALFNAATRLKVVSQMAVGVDNINIAEATRHGIPVGYTPGVLSQATADLTFALLLGAARRVVEADRWTRAGNWKLQFHPLHWLGLEVSDATIGIIGMGQIGLEVAKRALGFDMHILYYSRTRKPLEEEKYRMKYVNLTSLLSNSDFVTLHVPLTPETRHFIGERELRLMKPTAILINASRGPVVDQRALLKALQEKWIAGAALDVSEPEPIPIDDPLLKMDNVVITPHIGSASIKSRTKMAVLAAQNLLAGVKGKRLPCCVNPEVYELRK